MAITNTQARMLNGMCQGASQAELGTVVQSLQTKVDGVKRGTYTVVAADQTAGTFGINTGLTINGFIVQVYRAGKLLSSYAVSASTTILTIATNSTNYVVTTGDVVNYIVF